MILEFRDQTWTPVIVEGPPTDFFLRGKEMAWQPKNRVQSKIFATSSSLIRIGVSRLERERVTRLAQSRGPWRAVMTSKS